MDTEGLSPCVLGNICYLWKGMKTIFLKNLFYMKNCLYLCTPIDDTPACLHMQHRDEWRDPAQQITRNSLVNKNLCRIIIIDVLRFLGKRNISMYKKTYEKPTMLIVQLNQHGQLLAGSTVMESTRNSYGKANNDFSSDELNDDGEWEWN